MQLVGAVDQLQVRLVAQLADPAQIGQRPHRVDVVLVALRQPGQVLGDPVRVRAGRVEHPVVPGQDGRGELTLEPVRVRLGGGRGVDLHGEVDQHRAGLPDGDRVVDAPPVQLAQQHPLHRRPGRRRVAVLRQVDQAGEEPAVRLPAQRQPQPAALGQGQHADGRLVQVLGRRPEQLLAGQVGDHLQHPLPAVGRQRHAGQVDGRQHPAPDHRGVQHGLVQRGGGEQPDEPVLAVDHDLEGPVRPQHRAGCVGPGDDDQRPVGAEAGDGPFVRVAWRRRIPSPARVPLAPVPEEDETAVGQPAQQPGRLLPFRARRCRPARPPPRAPCRRCATRPRPRRGPRPAPRAARCRGPRPPRPGPGRARAASTPRPAHPAAGRPSPPPAGPRPARRRRRGAPPPARG